MSKLLRPEPKIDRKKELKNYENEYLTRYKEQQKSKPKKKTSKPLKSKPKDNRKTELKKYESDYLSRLKNKQ